LFSFSERDDFADQMVGVAKAHAFADQVIDKIGGQVEYAVMSTGGFLGIGENYSPVPWDSLVYDVNLGGYVIDADRARLEKAPRFNANAEPNWSDRSYAERVDEYWQVGRV